MLRAFLFTIALCLLISLTVYAQSQQPTPTPGKRSNPIQEKAKATTQKPYTDQRGTEQSPLIVKTIQPPKTQEEIDREKADHDEKAANDRRLIDYTGALADYTRALAWLTGGLVIVALFQFSVLFCQVRLFRKSLVATQSAAEAAQKSADIAAQTIHQMKIEEERRLRAYINIAPKETGGSPDVGVYIKNFGQTPAYNVAQWCKAIVLAFPAKPDFPFDDGEGIKTTHSTIPPGGQISLGVPTPRMSDDIFVTGLKVGSHAIYFCGRITYNDVFGKGRYTNFRLFIRTENGKTAMMYCHEGNDSN